VDVDGIVDGSPMFDKIPGCVPALLLGL